MLALYSALKKWDHLDTEELRVRAAKNAKYVILNGQPQGRVTLQRQCKWSLEQPNRRTVQDSVVLQPNEKQSI